MPGRAQVNVTLSNPSDCGVNIPLTDFNCPENVNFYNPDIFNIDVSTAPGTALGVDVYLKEVRLLLEHRWISDMNVALLSPSGVVVNLINSTGGNGDDFGDVSAADCSGAMVFSIGACRLLSQGAAPFIDGPYRAADDLYALNDGITNPNGTWELLICDDLADDTGTLQYVELVFEPMPCLPVKDVVLLSQDTTAATFTYNPVDLCGVVLVEIGPPGFVPGTDATAGGGQVFVVGCPPFTLSNLSESTDFDVYVRRACGTGFSDNACVTHFTTGCNPAAVTYTADFDDETTCTPACGTTCSLTGSWRNATGDGADWLAWQGSTPTAATGPTDDQTGGGKYLYIEANGTACTNGTTSVLQSGCFLLDKQGTDSCHLSFYYHQSGINAGSLRVQASGDGGVTWAPLWQRSGHQGSDWQKAYISLADFADGTTLQFRIIGTRGNGIYADIAIDDIRLHGSQYLGFPEQNMYADADGDGYGANGTPMLTCLATPPVGFAFNNLDCNDNNAAIRPDAPETPCNGVDENCNAALTDDDSLLPPPAVVNDTVCSGAIPTISALADAEYQILWYTQPDRSSGVVWVGSTYSPTVPANATDAPQQYRFYAEATNFVCSTPVLGEAIVTVLPRPAPSVGMMPSICPGDSVDLATIPVQDTHFTNAVVTYHSGSPAGAANQLASTVVIPEAATAYTFLLTSEDGCTAEASATVGVKVAPGIVFSPADSFSLCRDLRDTVLATVSGGSGDYQYFWETGRTTPTLPVQGATVAGTVTAYGLTVTDSAGCFSTDTVYVLTTNSIDSLRVFTEPTTDCNASDGRITVVPLNGLAPFGYQWRDENGNTGTGGGFSDTIHILNLPQNTYGITITDASAEGCQVRLRNTRIQGPGFQLDETDVVQPRCYGSTDGAICLDVNGSGTISYTWSGGQTTACITDLAAGTYSVTITNGACTTIESYTLEAPDSLRFFTQQQLPTCATATDGNLRIQTFGGTPPYTFDWGNGIVLPELSNIGAGSYPIGITDSKGCTLVGSAVLDAPALLNALVDANIPVSCAGGTDGLVRVSGTGGTLPYRFVWENGSTATQRTDLAAGAYALTLTDANACIAITTVTVVQPQPLVLVVTGSVRPVCNGDTTGEIAVAASGGIPPYLYVWDDGVSSPAATRSGLAIGTYSVRVRDGNGCESLPLTIDLLPESSLAITAAYGAPTCVGRTGSISANVSGGVGTLQYAWSSGASGSSLTNIPVGEYGLTVSDTRGCVADTVLVLAAPQVFEFDSRVVQPSCFGINDGIIDQTFIRQGQPPFQFFWSDNTQHVDQMFLGPGEYQFTVTDAVGCRFESEVFVMQYPAPLTLTVTDVGQIACAGDSTGFFETLPAGGTLPYRYNWVGTGNTNSTLYSIPAGTYQLSVTDARNCTVDTLLTLTDPAPLSVTATLELGNVCEPGAVDVLVGMASGGSQPYRYVWSNRATTASLVAPMPGDYALTVTDANGCSVSFGTIKVKERVEPLVLDSFRVQQVSCFAGQDAVLSAYVRGGSEQLRYHFSPTYITETDAKMVTATGIAFSNFYSVTITDVVTGCEVASPVVTGIQPMPIAIRRDSFSVVNCFGGADGSLYVSVEGGTGGYTYQWTNQTDTVVSAQQDLRFAAASIYNLLVTDANGCTAMLSDSNVVAINELIVIADTLVTPTRCRDGSDGALGVTIAGGVPPYLYNWSNGMTQPDITGLAAGLYNLTVTDSDTCRAIFTGLRVPQPTNALAVTGETEPVDCFGNATGSVTTTATGGEGEYTYRWRRNGVLIPSWTSASLSNLNAAQYQLQVTDTNMCTVTQTFTVAQPPMLEVVIDNFPNGAPNLTALTTGGTPPYTWQWSNGDMTQTIENLNSGNYVVTVADANDCSTTTGFLLTGTTGPSAESSDWTAFPNPTNGAIVLRRTATHPSMATRVVVYDAYGRQLQTILIPLLATEVPIDLSDLPTGTYWLRMHHPLGGASGWTTVVRQ